MFTSLRVVVIKHILAFRNSLWDAVTVIYGYIIIAVWTLHFIPNVINE